MQIEIVHSENDGPAGKLADAEIHFREGTLAGLKLVGFSIWEGRDGGTHVTLPARQYTVNGERRRFVLLRPTTDVGTTDTLRNAIAAAYDQVHERR